jgi:hypothetical protein
MEENPWIPLLELTGTFNVEDLPELNTEQLIARAKTARRDGEKELNYGQSISEILAGEGELKESQKSLATIGVWHFECALELFEKAIRNYKRAAVRELSKDRLKGLESQIEECQKQIISILGQKKTAGDWLSAVKK